MESKQIQKAGDGSQQIQAGTVNVYGITEARAREIFSEMNAIARQSYTQDAYDLALKRVGMFEELLMQKVEKVNGLLEAFGDPSFQFLLTEAQRRAAASDRDADIEMLTELLAHAGENNAHLEAPMAFVHDAADAFAGRAAYSDDIFVFRGHGGAGRIAFYDENGSWLGRIAVNSYVFSNSNSRCIDSCSDNQLSTLRCVLYIGCSTGVDFTHSTGTYNLVDSTYEKGAHFVLGTTETVYASDSNAFLNGFLTELSTNQSNIYTCVQKGVIKAGTVSSESGSYPLYYVGDSRQYLD